MRHSPCSVGSRASATRCTSRSRLEPVRDELRDRDEDDVVLGGERSSCGRRAAEPSSFRISQITPAGDRPASRARSTAASVWPDALQHAALARAEREHVAAVPQVGPARRRDRPRRESSWRGRAR